MRVRTALKISLSMKSSRVRFVVLYLAVSSTIPGMLDESHFLKRQIIERCYSRRHIETRHSNPNHRSKLSNQPHHTAPQLNANTTYCIYYINFKSHLFHPHTPKYRCLHGVYQNYNKYARKTKKLKNILFFRAFMPKHMYSATRYLF